MTSRLPLTPITDLPHLSKFLTKPPQTAPSSRPLPLSCYPTFCSLRRNVLPRSIISRPNVVSEQVVESSTSDTAADSETKPLSSSSKLVLVVGGTGGVGQLVVASLLNPNIKSRLLLRNPEKATTLFGEQDENKLQVCQGDTRNPKDLDPTMFEGVTHVICCTGTTAFPSRRWDGDNTPERGEGPGSDPQKWQELFRTAQKPV